MIQVKLLGGVAVQRDDMQPPTFRSDKVRALLAYLAVEADRAHTRSSLAALLWPEQREEVARNNLSQTLLQLRAALGDTQNAVPLLHVSRQTIQWNQSNGVQLDVDDFTRFARNTTATAWEQAATLYRGEFLRGFSLPACEAFENWLLLTREHLERRVLEVLEQLAQRALTAGSFQEAIHYAQRQLALDPWREGAYRQLMLAFAASGQRAAALAQYDRCQQVLFEALGVPPDDTTTALYEQIKRGDIPARVDEQVAQPATMHSVSPLRYGLDDASDVGMFYGRVGEQDTLLSWLLRDRCRMIAVVGLGGVGKTALAAQVARHVANQFDVVIWHSLVNAPPLAETMRVMLEAVSEYQATLPATLDEQFDLLVEYLRRRRCLLVFDNLESVLQGGEAGPAYRPGYTEYGQVLLRLAQTHHASCLLLTSREEPPEFARLLDGANSRQGAVHTLAVRGLDDAAAEVLLSEHGITSGNTAELVRHYSGHPLALKLVADTICDYYAGDVTTFLREDASIFADIRMVLDEQFVRLGRLEQDILVWLAIGREPTSIVRLQAELLPKPERGTVIEAVRHLRRRSLLEVQGAELGLQNVVMEYMTERVIRQICDEVTSGTLDRFERFALLHTSTKAYVRHSQTRLLAQPIAQRLAHQFGEKGVRTRAEALLDALRTRPRVPSYAAGNILNVLLAGGWRLDNLDCSELCVWQADLREAEAQGVNFVHADLAGTRFSDTFASITSITFTPDGATVIASCADGTLRMWRVRDGHPLHVVTGHAGVVWTVAASHDGRWLASGGDDQTVRLWDATTGQVVRVLHGHSKSVERVAFHPDGHLLASAGADAVVYLWDTTTGQIVQTLRGHTSAVMAVAFGLTDTHSSLLATGGIDCTICIWDVATGTLVQRLTGHERRVRWLEWSRDGSTLLSCAAERSIRLWDTATWHLRQTLSVPDGIAPTAALSADGATVVSGHSDTIVRVWDSQTGQIIGRLTGHSGRVHGVAFSSDGATVASGGSDQTARLWDWRSGRELHTLVGHSNWITSLAFTLDGARLVSGQWDHSVRVWDVQRGVVQHTLREHADRVTTVACNPDGTLAASGSADATICLWKVQTGQRQGVLRGHTASIMSVAFHPDGHMLASASEDGTVRVWDVSDGYLIHILAGHREPVAAVAFSPDGRVLVSGSQDRTMIEWDVERWQVIRTLVPPESPGRVSRLAFNRTGTYLVAGCSEGMIDLWDATSRSWLRRFSGHTNEVSSVVFAPDGTSLVSCSDDTTIRVWDVATGTAQQVWAGHPIRTMAVAFQPSKERSAGTMPLLASAGCDESIKIWDVETVTCVQTVRPAGPYQGMHITEATGLNDAQRRALTVLGAIA